jgi:hypothetical protein
MLCLLPQCHAAGQGYAKVEECATGVIHCAILSAVHPGCIAPSKVKADARQEHECIHNFKLLQVSLREKVCWSFY